MPPEELLKQLLGDVPEAAFFNAIRGLGTTPARRRFFESQFQPTLNRFRGRQGEQLLGGAMPSLTFQDFLSRRGPQFNREFFQKPRANRGASSGFFNPRTRFLLGF
jgi:hypothetical protein